VRSRGDGGVEDVGGGGQPDVVDVSMGLATKGEEGCTTDFASRRGGKASEWGRSLGCRRGGEAFGRGRLRERRE
jgi:hypothetical protein